MQMDNFQHFINDENGIGKLGGKNRFKRIENILHYRIQYFQTIYLKKKYIKWTQ